MKRNYNYTFVTRSKIHQKRPPAKFSEVGTLTPLTHIYSESLGKCRYKFMFWMGFRCPGAAPPRPEKHFFWKNFWDFFQRKLSLGRVLWVLRNAKLFFEFKKISKFFSKKMFFLPWAAPGRRNPNQNINLNLHFS